jgi:hypothetical protein
MIKVALAAPVVAGVVGGLGVGTVVNATPAHADSSSYHYQRGYNFAMQFAYGSGAPFPGIAFRTCNNATTGMYYDIVTNSWAEGATDFLQGCMAGAHQKGWQ